MQHTYICRECFAPGHNDDHSSTRSKLTGLYSLPLFLHQACHPNLVAKPKFQLVCVGKSMLHWLWNSSIVAPNEPRYELLCSTQFLLANCSYEVVLVDVYSHQNTGALTFLSCEAQLNIALDAMAKDKLAWYVPGPKQYTLHLAYGGCYLGNTQVVKNLVAQFRDFINGQLAITYWKHRHGFLTTTAME